MLGCTT
jgi:hypothetical protein